MSLDTTGEVKTQVKRLLGATSDKVSSTGFTTAIDQALAELGMTVPETDSKKCYWIIERARRHVLYILMVEAAYKFQYKKIYMHHRFQNYFKLIQFQDKSFLEAIKNDDDGSIFPDDIFTDSDGNSWLASYLTSGFNYTELGADITYGSDW